MTTVPTTRPERIYPDGYCLASFAGYGACVLEPGHDLPHRDATGHPFMQGTREAPPEPEPGPAAPPEPVDYLSDLLAVAEGIGNTLDRIADTLDRIESACSALAAPGPARPGAA